MRVLSEPYRFCRQMLCGMGARLGNNHFIFEWFKPTSWHIVVKVCLGLAFPLLAIRYWSRGGRSEPGQDEENNTSSKRKARDEEDPQSEGPLPQTATEPVPEPVKSSSVDEDKEECGRSQWRVDDTDELYCEYDSTWDTEDDSQDQSRDRDPEEDTGNSLSRRPRRFRNQSSKFKRFQAAAKDLQNYRHDYPHKPLHWRSPVSDGYPNLEFYLGQRASLPDNVYIHEFHDEWYGNYEALESVHSYIQWLFPLQEPGMNCEASTLTKEEIQQFCQNDAAKKNLLKSYKLMLDFYGIELCDEETGEVRRAPNWRERSNNLNNRTHNSLRITRILKCLATLGFQHYQSPLVRFFLEETVRKGELPNVKDSVLNYFLFAVRDKRQRRRLLNFAYLNYDKSEEFVWCPKKIQRKWSGLLASNKNQQGPEVTDVMCMF